MNTVAMASGAIYEFLLLAYPQQFRRRYGPEMVSVFSENCSYAYQSCGSYAVIGLWLSTLQDLLISASAEHLSSFLCRTKTAVLAISPAPMFVAATGALVGALSFISTVFVRINVYHDSATLQQFSSIGIAVVNIASLWFTSGLVLRLSRHVLGGTTFDRTPFVSRLRAFNHLASISLVLALVAILKYVVSDAPLKALSLQSLSGPQRWLVFPLIVVCTVSSVILLDPLLTLRFSVSKGSNREPAARSSVLRLSLTENSAEHNL
jgi:hypothetical protein